MVCSFPVRQRLPVFSNYLCMLRPRMRRCPLAEPSLDTGLCHALDTKYPSPVPGWSVFGSTLALPALSWKRAMQKALFIKAALVAAIFVLLQVPLKMIDGIVAERWARQQAVVQELASQSYGKQTLAGPILSIPYVEEYEDTVVEDGARKVETRRIYRIARFFPLNSNVISNATVETKSRGLFKARVFNWQG